MEARSLEYVAAACAGRLVGGCRATVVLRVCTDSRQVQRGDVFFALAGERFDGHDFLPAVAHTAVAVVVRHDRTIADLGGCARILVDDTRAALGRLGARYRAEFNLPVVAVAGSNGKTTTKELIASVLGQGRNTLKSDASFNNEIGVPLTLLRLDQQHQAAVLELGTNHPGELAPLARMIQPKYGVITCIGREHLEFFGDLAGVANEEGSLAELLPPSGKLFLNGDDEWSGPIAARSKCPVVRVGMGDKNHWRALEVRPEPEGLAFHVQGPRAELVGDYRLGLLGRHQAVNALFAIALAAELGLGRAEITRGLAACKPPKMRLQFWESNGIRVLDDAYNANADSMRAALQTFQDLPFQGRRVAVLGDMAELGPHSQAAHEEVGRRAAELGVDQLFAVGKMAPFMAQGARSAGLNRVLEFIEVEAAAAAIRQFVRGGDLVLLKASRASRLERIADVLRAGAR